MASWTIYVYAIAGPEPAIPAGLKGMFGEDLETVECGDVTLVFSSHVDPPATLGTDHAVFHHTVVTELSAHGPVLPVRFGTTFASRSGAIASIQENTLSLVTLLNRLSGTVEYGLVTVWAENELENAAPEPQTLPAEPDGSPARTYMRDRLAAFRRQEHDQHRATKVSAQLDTLFEGLVIDKVESLLPDPDIPLRASYLVARDRATEFVERFDGARLEIDEIRMLLSGPWPPYSFAVLDSGNMTAEQEIR